MKKIIAYLILTVLCFGHAYADADSTAVMRKPRAAEIVTGTAAGLALNAGITEALKHGVHEMRPDGSANNSFPSRHTSWAFAASTLISNYTWRYSPWFGVGAHAIAGAIGAQRVADRRHYASDVIIGAVTGIASAELATFVSRKIFGGPSPLAGASVYNDFTMSFAVETGAAYALNKPGGLDYCTGAYGALRYRLPLSEHWGIGISAEGTVTPVKYKDTAYPLGTVGLRAGGAAHFVLPCQSLAIEPGIEVGVQRVLSHHIPHGHWGFTSLAECALSWRLSHNFACRATANVRFATIPDAVATIGLSLSSVVLF